MKQSKIPWIIASLMAVYVYGLTFYAHNRVPPEPRYAFYDTTAVSVFIEGAEEIHSVYGRYNNILEGQRELIKAATMGDGAYRLSFQVNSPRPATIFINDEALEIFLLPGDTSLKIHLRIDPITYMLDSLEYSGRTDNICQYFRDKTVRFDQAHLRAARHIIASGDFVNFAGKLDSMAARELGFLAEQEVFATLPDWFVSFEKNEILYQKAYLKLSAAFNLEVDEALFDRVALDNSKAVFSYYYYLYLKTYLTRELQREGYAAAPEDGLKQIQFLKAQLSLGDELLSGEPQDVFICRTIFQQIRQEKLITAEELLIQYEDRFSKQKYARFLRAQLSEGQQPI